MPFSLSETEELFKDNGIVISREQVIDSYMVFGGIPYYISLFDRRLSLPQNIDELLFKESGTAKALHLTMITSAGLQHNVHSGQVINEITADDLFTDITL